LNKKHNIENIRIDIWLWYARFFHTRKAAQLICNNKQVRINGNRILKASKTVKPGDILTFPYGQSIRVIQVIQLPTRRISSKIAKYLYEEK